ncbi:hypothetical protein TU94_23865 [Streptomyces cyaneogriseus subsp. noncyanogenus]|uniref:Cupin n=1 Tax=Streptomyces cyaneogriseus subsp. noncyanogenus TaxID=477245 RepID=A0A0C5FVK6_9ACTN|nr:hypothetical protein [Streptomyces cyaneogriseus]AJP04057.1 hypothetical protein TU94_23865 [Streptomyces cyaneogriseus subsp. noncyanogenus]
MDYPALERAARREDTAEVTRHAASELRHIASGHSPLRAVRHPLGFICLPVLRDGPYGVCVHVFGSGETAGTPQPGPAVPDVHSHSWDLTSTVLYGRLGNRRMRVRERAEEPTHRVFEVHSDPSGVDEVRPTGRLVTCSPGAEQTSVRGQTYDLPAGEFHTTVVPGGRPTATLVLGRTVPGRADLSLGPLRDPGHRMVRRTCDATQTARIARAVLRRMHEPGPEPPG